MDHGSKQAELGFGKYLGKLKLFHYFLIICYELFLLFSEGKLKLLYYIERYVII